MELALAPESRNSISIVVGLLGFATDRDLQPRGCMIGGNFRFNSPLGTWSFTAGIVVTLTSIAQGIDHALKEDRVCTRGAFLYLDFTPV